MKKDFRTGARDRSWGCGGQSTCQTKNNKEVWSSLSQEGSKEEAIAMVEAGDMLDDQEQLGAEWQRRKGMRSWDGRLAK